MDLPNSVWKLDITISDRILESKCTRERYLSPIDAVLQSGTLWESILNSQDITLEFDNSYEQISDIC